MLISLRLLCLAAISRNIPSFAASRSFPAPMQFRSRPAKNCQRRAGLNSQPAMPGSLHILYGSYFCFFSSSTIAGPISLVFALPPRSGVSVFFSTSSVSMAFSTRLPQVFLPQ